jgi:hypothetical protein
MTSAITATGLRKSFGGKPVLDGIDLEVGAGTTFSLLGRQRGRPAPPLPVRLGGRRDQGRVPDQPAAGRGALASRRPAAARPAGDHGRGIAAVGRPRRDPRNRRHRRARPGPGPRPARRPGRADGQHRRLQRPAVGRTGGPDHPPDRHPGPVITVNLKAVEIAGHPYIEAPKNRKHRKTIYPRLTPTGYPLAARLAARTDAARAEQAAGTNPLGLIFPSPKTSSGGLPTSTAASWPRLPRRRLVRPQRPRHLDLDLPAPRLLHHRPLHLELDPTDVSRMAGHANYRITLDMYITTAGILFLAEQRGDRTVIRLADRESGLSARTIARRLSSVSGLHAYLPPPSTTSATPTKA